MTNDQKRALGIGGIGIAGFLVWRHMHGGTTAVQKVPVTPTGTIAPYTPQAPIPLSPGQSIYDPNSQDLLSTPDALTQPTPVDTSNSAAGPGNQTTTAIGPRYIVNVNYPRRSAPRHFQHRKAPLRRKPNRKAKR